MTLFSQKITLFLVLGVLVIILGIAFAVYYYRRDVTGIGVGVMIVAVLVAVAAIALDRLAVRFMSPGWLSAIELVIVLLAGTWYGYFNRSVTLDLSANPSPYFVVIWAKSGTETQAFQYRFPFDKVAVVPTGNVAQLDQSLFSVTTVTVPAHWKNGQFSRGITLSHPRFVSAYFYGSEVYFDKQTEVDNLLQQAVNQQNNH
jgi:hypothetical protein